MRDLELAVEPVLELGRLTQRVGLAGAAIGCVVGVTGRMREGIDGLLQLPVRVVDEACDLRLGIGQRGAQVARFVRARGGVPAGVGLGQRLFAPS